MRDLVAVGLDANEAKELMSQLVDQSYRSARLLH
jgi:hypothetical protein